MRHTKGAFIPAKVDWANGTISGTVYGGEPELTKLMEKVSDAVIHTSLGIAHYFACFHFEKYDRFYLIVIYIAHTISPLHYTVHVLHGKC